MTITTKLVLKDMPTTGLTGIGGEGGWTGDSDIDFVVEATGTSALNEVLNISTTMDKFTMTKGTNNTFVFVPDNVDDSMITTKDVERVVFTDKAIALDVTGAAGNLYALLAAGIGQSDVTSTYMGIGLALQDTGKSDVELAQILIDSVVYKADALGTSNETFVKHVYKNITGQTISLADLTVFTGWLDSKAWTQAELLNAASDLTPFRETTLVGLADTGIEYIPFVI